MYSNFKYYDFFHCVMEDFMQKLSALVAGFVHISIPPMLWIKSWVLGF